MKLDRYYQILVMGGFVLGNGCGASPTDINRLGPSQPENDNANIERQNSKTKSDQTKEDTKIDCAKICTVGGGAEKFCPESVGSEQTNCCWLMPEPRHPCCDQLD